MGSSGNPNFIEVRHGRMLISVPRSMFRTGTSHLRAGEADRFKTLLAARYPWLTKAAIEVVIEEAQETMESLLDLERGTVERARARHSQGRQAEALSLLEGHLRDHPSDPDAWYLKGEILFRMGRRGEAFAAFARARGHK